MANLIGVDPGTSRSAFVVLESGSKKILDFGLTENEILLDWILSQGKTNSARLIAEVFKSYGNIIGDSVLQTCVWLGRFVQAFGYEKTAFLTRKEIVTHVCHNPRANDANVRQALIDLFPATGGGKTPSIGTKTEPGPLYGIKGDIWSALAVAVTWDEKNSFLL